MFLAAFRLAFYLRRPVSELNITSREFTYWLAYLGIEPPEEGDNVRTASLMAHIANWSGKSMKKGRTAKADDYLGKKKPQQTEEEQKAFFRSLTPAKKQD